MLIVYTILSKCYFYAYFGTIIGEKKVLLLLLRSVYCLRMPLQELSNHRRSDTGKNGETLAKHNYRYEKRH